MSPSIPEEQTGLSASTGQYPDPGDFLGLLDEKLRRQNERLRRRLFAWGELLNSAGWCVALDLPGEVRPWLSDLAHRDLQGPGGVPGNWNGVLASISRIPGNSLHRRSEGVLIWSGRASTSSVPQSAVGLTKREAEVMDWLREGKTSPEIAIILGCAVRTVEKHLANLYRKIGANSRAEVILKNPKSMN